MRGRMRGGERDVNIYKEREGERERERERGGGGGGTAIKYSLGFNISTEFTQHAFQDGRDFAMTCNITTQTRLATSHHSHTDIAATWCCMTYPFGNE